MTKPKIIFFGNGPLAEFALENLKDHTNILFHAKTKSDLKQAEKVKQEHPDAHAILASFGHLIPESTLQIFEPEGILNIHPSRLPKYRGPSPIESAILNGDTEFFVSIMKLVKEMDAGPVFVQLGLTTHQDGPFPSTDSLIPKTAVYHALADMASRWLLSFLGHLPDPSPQTGKPTYTQKLDTSLSPLDPSTKSARELLNQIRAYQDFPKSRYNFFGKDCIIKAASVRPPEPAELPLALECRNGQYLVIEELQPAGKKPMSATAFINGYAR